MSEKTYLNCQAKSHTFDNGGTIIKLGIKADDLIEFARQHRNQGGYVNLVVAERRQPGRFGETHTVYLDTYSPRSRD